MAEQLSGGNVALALLANTLCHRGRALCADRGLRAGERCALQPGRERGDGLARHAALVGAPFLRWRLQLSGAVLGAWLAHGMFDLPVWQLSTKLRSSPPNGWPNAWPPSGWCS